MSHNKTEFLDKYDEITTDSKKGANQDQFVAIMRSIETELPVSTIQLYFKGIDVDGSKSVSREEFEEFVTKYLENDMLYSVKLLFRAFDEDRSGNIEADEFRQIAECAGKQMTEEEAKNYITENAANKKSLKFAEVYKSITGKTIAADFDPYDGKRSKCCLIF